MARGLILVCALSLLLALVAADCGQCYNHKTKTMYPYCCTFTQTDGRGYGWENGKVCLAKGTAAQAELCPDHKQMCGGWRLCTADTRSEMECNTAKSAEGWCTQFQAVCIKLGAQAQLQHCPHIEDGIVPPKKHHHKNETKHHHKNETKHVHHHKNTTKGECPLKLRCPTECDWQCGCEVVSGLHARKERLEKLGAHLGFIASAMLHTHNLSIAEIRAHHNVSNATNATHLAPLHRRFGLTRLEWDFVKTCHKPWKNASHERAHVLHDDREREIEIYHECARHYTHREFLSGLRDGVRGLEHPNGRDARCFREAHAWVEEHLERGHHKHDDVRFFVKLPVAADEVRHTNTTRHHRASAD